MLGGRAYGMKLPVYQHLLNLNAGFDLVVRSFAALRKHDIFQAKELDHYAALAMEAGESRSNHGVHHELACVGGRDRPRNPAHKSGTAQNDFSARLGLIGFRLPWAGESEITSIVTVGPARDVGLSQDPNSRARPSPQE
jgi:hypothetical protein